jgi:hypothetical protein
MRQNKFFGTGSVSLGAVLLGAALTQEASAVIFYSTGDTTYNTTAPSGGLADSGWQWMGAWGGVTGTPISPNQFITATHVGGSIGDQFVYGGVSYTTTGVAKNSGDLSVWTVSGTFSTYAPILTTTPSIGASAVIMGRGTQRGTGVQQNGELKGWEWGASDGVMRWGENNVAGNSGTYLRFTFDSSAGPNEVHLSGGDSGGGVFIQDNGEWKLAGINYGVEGPYSLTSGGASFNAAIFDRGGLYRAGSYIAESGTDNPSSFYATSLAANYSWISSVIVVQVPEPSTVALLGLSGAALAFGKFRRRG